MTAVTVIAGKYLKFNHRESVNGSTQCLIHIMSGFEDNSKLFKEFNLHLTPLHSI